MAREKNSYRSLLSEFGLSLAYICLALCFTLKGSAGPAMGKQLQRQYNACVEGASAALGGRHIASFSPKWLNEVTVKGGFPTLHLQSLEFIAFAPAIPNIGVVYCQYNRTGIILNFRSLHVKMGDHLFILRLQDIPEPAPIEWIKPSPAEIEAWNSNNDETLFKYSH